MLVSVFAPVVEVEGAAVAHPRVFGSGASENVELFRFARRENVSPEDPVPVRETRRAARAKELSIALVALNDLEEPPRLAELRNEHVERPRVGQPA